MEQKSLNKKEIVQSFLKKGFLLSSEVLENIKKKEDLNKIFSLDQQNTKYISVLSEDTKKILNINNNLDVNWIELDKLRVLSEKGINSKNYTNFLKYYLCNTGEENKREILKETNVKILYSYIEESKKRDVEDFVRCFSYRYDLIEKILRNRKNINNLTSINHVHWKKR